MENTSESWSNSNGWLSNENFRFFFMNSLAGQRIWIGKLIFATVNLTWLPWNTGNNRLLIIIITWIWIITIGLVFIWTTEVQQRFWATTQLIWPITALDTFIIEQAMWITLTTGRNAPWTFRIEDVTLMGFVFGKETELIWATWWGNWCSYRGKSKRKISKRRWRFKNSKKYMKM